MPGNSYFSDSITDIYDVGFAIEDNAEELELSFSFTYNLQEIDTYKMTQDGYIFSREP